MERKSNSVHISEKIPQLVAVRSASESLLRIRTPGTLEEKRLYGWEPPASLETSPYLFCCIFLNSCCYRGKPEKKFLVQVQGGHLSAVANTFPLLTHPSVKYFVCVSHFRRPDSELTKGRGKGVRSDIIAKWVENFQIPPGYWLRIPTPPKSDQFRAWHYFNSDWERLIMSESSNSSHQNTPR